MEPLKPVPQIVTLGIHRHLRALLHTGENLETAEPPLLILLNSGWLSSVGPHRIYVKIAESAARVGVDCLRLDLSGLGESRSRRDFIDENERMGADIFETIDEMQKRFGYRRFYLFGICSGAEYGFWAALKDRRIKGWFGVESYAYKTGPFQLRKALNRLRPKNILRKLFTKILGLFKKQNSQSPSLFYESRNFPPVTTIEPLMFELLKNGCAIQMLNNKGSSHLMNSQKQWFEFFPKLRNHPQFKANFWPEVDHTFTSVIAQDRLVDLIIQWTRELSFSRRQSLSRNERMLSRNR